MSQSRDNAIDPVVDALRDRCSAVGFLLWSADADGRLCSAPEEPTPLGQLGRSEACVRTVNAVVRAWMSSDAPPRPEPLNEIVQLIPLPIVRRRRTLGWIAVGVVTDPLPDGTAIRAVSTRARVNADLLAEHLRATAWVRPDQLPSIGTMLGWTQGSLDELERERTSLTSVSKQLADSYEELTLMYKLRESMSELAHPLRFIRRACNELQDVMRFKWVSVHIGTSEALDEASRGTTLVEGTPPVTRSDFAVSLAPLVGDLEVNFSVVLDAEQALERLGFREAVALSPIGVAGATVGVIAAGAGERDRGDISSIDVKMLEAAAGFTSVVLENAALYEDQRAMFLGTLQALTATIDAKDPYTSGHSERVAYLSAEIARQFGMHEDRIERVRIAGLVHDIGKIGVPESVLCKPGRLTDEEFGIIKLHPEIGHTILRDIPHLDDILPGVLHHHERFDGRGYPHRLEGQDIPMVARIIGLADAFDAMSSSRTYRAAMPRDRVLTEIEQGSGTQFDPAIAKRFLEIDLADYDAMVARHAVEQHEGKWRTAA
jgi:HD-GYP domain-containing protein (c-di-GMP phosphodiesterase class II)